MLLSSIVGYGLNSVVESNDTTVEYVRFTKSAASYVSQMEVINTALTIADVNSLVTRISVKRLKLTQPFFAISPTDPQKTKRTCDFSQVLVLSGGPCWTRTSDQAIMRTMYQH